MSSKTESIIVALDPFTEKTVARSGAMSRVHFALSRHPEGLSLSEIAEITGLKPSTIDKHGVRNLFNFQVVDRIQDVDRGTVYKLTDRMGYGLHLASPEEPRRGEG